MRVPQILAIGETMLELARDGDEWRLGVAGDTYNTAVYLARLGLPATYLTALGTDPFSAEIRDRMTAEGVDTSLVLTDPTRLPGLYAIRTDRRGERNFFYWRETSAARRLFALGEIDAALAAARQVRLLYLSGITLSLFDRTGRSRLIDLAAAVRTQGGHVAFDPNYRPACWPSPGAAREAVSKIAPYISIALPTLDDEAALFGSCSPDAVIERWTRQGAREVAVKMGPKGCVISGPAGPQPVPADAHVIARDTTGAGDAFNAGYLAARWTGRAQCDAADFGNKLAAEVVRHAGAIIPSHATPMLATAAETEGDCA